MSRDAREPMDFRSAAFSEDALQLTRSTGCTLVQCRQELFIAEGDVDEARRVLLEQKAAAAGGPPLH